MKNQPMRQMKDQGAPVLLLAHLYKTLGHLPAPNFQLDHNEPELLTINLHNNLPGFEIWREALALDTPEPFHYRSISCLSARGSVADVPVRLVGFAEAADVDAAMTALYAVSAVAA